jgi:hypothetical protein
VSRCPSLVRCSWAPFRDHVPWPLPYTHVQQWTAWRPVAHAQGPLPLLSRRAWRRFRLAHLSGIPVYNSSWGRRMTWRQTVVRRQRPPRKRQ